MKKIRTIAATVLVMFAFSFAPNVGPVEAQDAGLGNCYYGDCIDIGCPMETLEVCQMLYCANAGDQQDEEGWYNCYKGD